MYGFKCGGYQTDRSAFSRTPCKKMYKKIQNFLRDTHDTPRYQRLIAAINSNLEFHGLAPLENKSVLIPVLFEVLRTLPLDLPPFALDESRKNDALWVNIPYRIESFI